MSDATDDADSTITTPMTLSTATVASSSIAVDDRVSVAVAVRPAFVGMWFAVAVTHDSQRAGGGHRCIRPELVDLACEVVTARGVVLVPVERRARRRQEHDVARAARRAAARRTASRIDAAAADGHPRAREGGLHLAGRLTDGDDGAHAVGVRAQAAEIEILVAAARDEDDVVEASQRADRGVRVGGLGVVDVAHAGDLSDRLDAVRQLREPRRARRRWRRPARPARGPRRWRSAALKTSCDCPSAVDPYHPARARRPRARTATTSSALTITTSSGRWCANTFAFAAAYASERAVPVEVVDRPRSGAPRRRARRRRS